MNEEGLKNLLGSVSQQLEKSTKVTVSMEIYGICKCTVGHISRTALEDRYPLWNCLKSYSHEFIYLITAHVAPILALDNHRYKQK